jgi:hypothetical protein
VQAQVATYQAQVGVREPKHVTFEVNQDGGMVRLESRNESLAHLLHLAKNSQDEKVQLAARVHYMRCLGQDEPEKSTSENLGSMLAKMIMQKSCNNGQTVLGA